MTSELLIQGADRGLVEVAVEAAASALPRGTDVVGRVGGAVVARATGRGPTSPTSLRAPFGGSYEPPSGGSLFGPPSSAFGPTSAPAASGFAAPSASYGAPASELFAAPTAERGGGLFDDSSTWQAAASPPPDGSFAPPPPSPRASSEPAPDAALVAVLKERVEQSAPVAPTATVATPLAPSAALQMGNALAEATSSLLGDDVKTPIPAPFETPSRPQRIRRRRASDPNRIAPAIGEAARTLRRFVDEDVPEGVLLRVMRGRLKTTKDPAAGLKDLCSLVKQYGARDPAVMDAYRMVDHALPRLPERHALQVLRAVLREG